MPRPLKDKEEDKTIIKQIMREKGITVKELAGRMGKATTTVSIQLNNNNMTVETLSVVAKALGVEISDLFPVPQGYVHYMEAKNIAQNIRQPEPRAAAIDEMALAQKVKEILEEERKAQAPVSNPVSA